MAKGAHAGPVTSETNPKREKRRASPLPQLEAVVRSGDACQHQAWSFERSQPHVLCENPSLHPCATMFGWNKTYLIRRPISKQTNPTDTYACRCCPLDAPAARLLEVCPEACSEAAGAQQRVGHLRFIRQTRGPPKCQLQVLLVGFPSN